MKNKKGYSSVVLIPALVLIGLIGYLFVYPILFPEKAESRKIMDIRECVLEGFDDGFCEEFYWNTDAKVCYGDCVDLNKEFFTYKWSESLFGKNEYSCFCKENDESNRIW